MITPKIDLLVYQQEFTNDKIVLVNEEIDDINLVSKRSINNSWMKPGQRYETKLPRHHLFSSVHSFGGWFLPMNYKTREYGERPWDTESS